MLDDMIALNDSIIKSSREIIEQYEKDLEERARLAEEERAQIEEVIAQSRETSKRMSLLIKRLDFVTWPEKGATALVDRVKRANRKDWMWLLLLAISIIGTYLFYRHHTKGSIVPRLDVPVGMDRLSKLPMKV